MIRKVIVDNIVLKIYHSIEKIF